MGNTSSARTRHLSPKVVVTSKDQTLANSDTRTFSRRLKADVSKSLAKKRHSENKGGK